MFEWTVGRGVLSNSIKLIKTLKTNPGVQWTRKRVRSRRSDPKANEDIPFKCFQIWLLSDRPFESHCGTGGQTDIHTERQTQTYQLQAKSFSFKTWNLLHWINWWWHNLWSTFYVPYPLCFPPLPKSHSSCSSLHFSLSYFSSTSFFSYVSFSSSSFSPSSSSSLFPSSSSPNIKNKLLSRSTRTKFDLWCTFKFKYTKALFYVQT